MRNRTLREGTHHTFLCQIDPPSLDRHEGLYERKKFDSTSKGKQETLVAVRQMKRVLAFV